VTAFPPVPLVEGVAAPLLRDNIDTDQIIPSREIKGVGKTELADGLFAGWRYRQGREPDPAFVLNDPAFAHAPILLAGANMGCGSSREHAVWALHEYGVRAVIAPSFAPIFRGNCVRNGVIPVELAPEQIAVVARAGAARVDLAQQTVSPAVGPIEGRCPPEMASRSPAGSGRTEEGWAFSFAIDPEAKAMLAEGLDAIDLTFKHRDAIAAFLATDRDRRPWIYLEATA
jgi:3-isopropylmalate/(R)-2-methylmalate dehydratase small subunit